MKRYVILAALLLVPSMAYLQVQKFERVSGVALREEVRAVLEREEVREAKVGMEWLDGTIEGIVATRDARMEVGAQVEALEGVRLARGGNRLRVVGWVEVSRQEGRWRAEGLLPKEFVLRGGGGLGPGQEDQWDAGVERDGAVVSPVEALEWAGFLREFFAEPGNRRVMVIDGRLAMGGEATRGLREAWLASAARLFGEEALEEEFRLRPSVYHFESYEPGSVDDAKELAQLRKSLRALVISFAPGSAVVRLSQEERLLALADLILSVDAKLRLVMGLSVGAGDEEALALANDRLDSVEVLLRGYGVSGVGLERRIFDGDPDREEDGRVEFLVK